MSWITRLRSTFWKSQLEDQLDDELQFHIEMRTQEFIASGIEHEEARRRALRLFGNRMLLKERTRDMDTLGWMETLMQDLRYALRMMRRSPGFTAVAVLSLALGIGANTAIFSLIDAVMLRMLPVSHAEQLVLLSWAAPKWGPYYRGYSGWGGCPDTPGRASGCSFSYPTFQDIQARNEVFSGVLAFAGMGRVNVLANTHAGFEEAESVSGDYFSTLGVHPILGRVFTPQDDRPGADPVVVISYGLWLRRFGRDPAIAGKSIWINGTAFTIAGVAPMRFFGLQPGWRRDLWIPLAMLPKSGSSRKAESFHARDDWWVMIMARLKPGIREEQARGTVDVIFRQGVAASATRALKPEEVPHVELFSGGKGLMILRQLYAKPLVILMTVVGLVLLIACANVANLLLARATARQKEISIRLSLGAGRRRLVAQLLTESTLLALLGGAVGLLLACKGSELLLTILSAGPMPIQLDVHPGLPVLAFTAGVSLLTGILFGLAPALHATRVDLTPALKASAGNLYGAIGSRRLRFGPGKALVVGQVAISLLLLVGAGLFLRTLMNLENVNLGFSPRHILLFGLKLPQNFSKDQRTPTPYKDLLERLQNLPGVLSASLSQDTLLSGNVSKRSISVDGYTPAPGEETSVIVLPVGPRFFETMGIRVLAGRTIEFRDTDRQPEPNVAVVNEAVARRYYAGQNPVGKQFTWGKQAIQIIGLVGDIKYDDLRQQPPAVVYIPFLFGNKDVDETHFELLAAANPGDLIPVVRRVVDQMNRNLSLFDLKTQNDQIDEMLYQERMFAKLTSAFGFLAMTLACVGLYGSMAYAVVRRTNEIGLRMALGAQRYSILRMIMGETLLLVMAGVAIGILVSLAATRALQRVLFGLKPGDPYTLAAASLLMLAVAAFAGYLPARRASRVDPMVALRYE